MKMFVVLLVAGALAAQDQPPATNAPVLNGAVSGIVRDKNTGQPLAGYSVSTYTGAAWVGNTITMSRATKEVISTTDESGHYRLADLPAGAYVIAVSNPSRRGGSRTEKHVATNGHDLNGINFDVIANGTIKGKVLDENKEPVPGVIVLLASREYFLGVAGYFPHASGRTNDRGEYSIDSVAAGEPWFLVADVRPTQLPAHSEAPLNPKLRRRIPMRTWYPNSPSTDGAAPVILRPGEVREGVSIEMKKSPNHCAEGTLLTANGGPGALRFTLEALQPSSGVSESGGMFMAGANGATGADGGFRICDLYPGSYRLQAMNTGGEFQFGSALVNVADEDVRGLKIATFTTVPVAGEVVLEGPVPAVPLVPKVRVSLQPLLRTFMQGEQQASPRADIPGPFTIAGVVPDDYMVRTFVNAPGLYVKDVRWDGISIFHQPLRLSGGMSGSGLRVVVGQDGGTLSATVATQDGNPAPDINVVAYPAASASEGSLAAGMVYGQTDQNGTWTSQPLAPGKYYVGAVDAGVDYHSETIARLGRSRNRFAEVDLAPGATGQVNLEPIARAP